MRRVLSLLLLCLSASCWPGWSFACDPTPAGEHRVEDLRVLALEVDRPNVLVAPGLLFGDAPAADAVPVHVAPRVFDPRGGGPIDVSLSLCAATPFAPRMGAPCPDGARQLASFRAEADADAPLGEVPGLEVDFALDAELARALYAEAGQPEGSLGVQLFEIVVSVSRRVDGRVERESGYVPWFLQLDALAADMPAARLFALLDEEHAMLCAGGEGDGCATQELPGCDPVCLVPPILPPLAELAGLKRSEQLGPYAINEEPEFAPGSSITVARGARLFLAPVIAIGEDTPTLQWSFKAVGQCAEDPAEGAMRLQCNSGFPANVAARFYVGDGAAELVAPGDPTSGYWGNEGAREAVAVAFDEGTPPGTQEPLVVVIASDRGAMDSAAFTLVAE